MFKRRSKQPPPLDQPKRELGDRYFSFLGLVLLGYAIGGRGFAYWGVNPIFVGEITLVIGLLLLLRKRTFFRVLNLGVLLPLILFMVWGLIRTVPYINYYKFDAIRDGVLWAYGIFAFIMVACLTDKPERIARVIPYYRIFATIYLMATPFNILIEKSGIELPSFPGSSVPFIQAKGGDIAVHLVGAFVFIGAFGGVNLVLSLLVVPVCAGLCMIGRAALMTICSGWGIFLALNPLNRRIWRIIMIMFLGLVVLWATEFHTGEKGDSRQISIEYLFKAFGSIFGSSGSSDDLGGTKEWRLNWWKDIYNYTVKGKYFWTGKGFGINLSIDDGYVVDEGGLRSPHNGHFSVLARSGVPGMALWAVVHGIWVAMILRAYFRARRRKDWKWSGLLACTLAYWAAIMVNASFDVYIEGPMGGVWLWNVYGFGIAAVWIFRRCPEVLYREETRAGGFPVVERPPYYGPSAPWPPIAAGPSPMPRPVEPILPGIPAGAPARSESPRYRPA